MPISILHGVANPVSFAPTLLTPANGSYADLSGTPTFTWNYNPGQAGNTQTGFQFLRITNGSATAQFWNGGTSTWQTTPYLNASTSPSITFPAGAWGDGNMYQWAVQTQDANGLGPASGYFALIAQANPTVTVTAPTGTITTSDPIVKWATTPARGAMQTGYRMVIYTAAQYGAVGFTPGSGPSVYDTALQGSSYTNTIDLSTIPIYLVDSTSYRAYVQVTETGGQSSAWSYSAFATSYTAPTTPSIAVVQTSYPATGAPCFEIVVIGGSTYPGQQSAIVLRTGSDGSSVYVRGASPANPAALPSVGETAVIYDLECVPNNVQYTYSAQVLAILGANNAVISASASAAAVILNMTTGSPWWFINPSDYSMATNAQPISWEPQVTEQSTAHLVTGQATPNVVANVMGGTDGQATLETFDPLTYANLETILQSQATIWVSSPFGLSDSGYVRFGPQTGGLSTGSGNKVKDSSLQASTLANMNRTTDVTFVAQMRPPV